MVSSVPPQICEAPADALPNRCPRVSEAEAMVYGGVKDVLVTNEVVGRQNCGG